MALIVRRQEECCRPCREQAARREVSPEEVAIEAIASRLPADAEDDALEAFIGSVDSGDPSWAERDTSATCRSCVRVSGAQPDVDTRGRRKPGAGAA